jgi:hypothetical protein
MQARLIAYPPDAAATTRWIEPGARLRIGRGQDCDVVLDHPSVSRAHAEIHHDGTSWRLRDLGSKNGSHVDGVAIQDQPLPAACWLRLGDSYCEFALFDRAQAEDIRHRQTERRALSAALTRKIAGETGSAALPGHVLHGVVELAGCTRGFLLLANGDDFSVSASLSLEPDALAGRAFSGSVGAVQRVLGNGTAVVVNDIGSEAWLAERASVIASDLKTLVCLPLLDRATVFGAVYADRRGTADGRPGEPITDFDLELLTAFAESATLYLLARHAMHLLDARRPDAAPRWNAIVEMHAVERQAGIAANLHGDVQ